jgi:hypothetical protein
MTQLSEIFYSNLVTICSGIMLAVVAVCYKSKCRNINCCYGLIQIDRDVIAEEHIDEHEHEHEHDIEMKNNL